MFILDLTVGGTGGAGYLNKLGDSVSVKKTLKGANLLGDSRDTFISDRRQIGECDLFAPETPEEMAKAAAKAEAAANEKAAAEAEAAKEKAAAEAEAAVRAEAVAKDNAAGIVVDKKGIKTRTIGRVIDNKFTKVIRSNSSLPELNAAWNNFFNSLGVNKFEQLPSYPRASGLNSTNNQLDFVTTMENLLPHLTRDAFAKFAEMTTTGGRSMGKNHNHVRFFYWVKEGHYDGKLNKVLITPQDILEIKVPNDFEPRSVLEVNFPK